MRFFFFSCWLHPFVVISQSVAWWHCFSLPSHCKLSFPTFRKPTSNVTAWKAVEKTTWGGEKGKQILSCMKLLAIFWIQWWTPHLSLNSLHSLCVSCLVKRYSLLFFFLFKYLVITSFTLSSASLCCSHSSLCCTWKPGVYRRSGVQWNEQLTAAQPVFCDLPCILQWKHQERILQNWQVSIDRDFNLFHCLHTEDEDFAMTQRHFRKISNSSSSKKKSTLWGRKCIL